MTSTILKRSIVFDGHKTSVSLEDAFWQGLEEIAQSQCTTRANIVATIDRAREHTNLSSAIRLFVLDHIRAQTMAYSANRVKGAAADALIKDKTSRADRSGYSFKHMRSV